MHSLYTTLRASLDALICPNCAGIGILVSYESPMPIPNGWRTSPRMCQPCDGNGTKPKEPT